MKHLIARTLTSLMLAIVGLAVAAPAQSTTVIQVNVPFEFSFGDRTFPAGDYSLTQPTQNVILLRNSRGQAVAQSLTAGVNSLSPSDGTKLMFALSGGQHILTEVWKRSDYSGNRLYPVKNSASLAQHRSTEARETAAGSQP